jgi:import inner membrane translocase subunit TIM8
MAGLQGVDPKLQQFIQAETERQRFQNVIHEINERCWDVCMDGKPSSRLDGRTESCLKNCVERFIDTNVIVTQRLEKKASEIASASGGELTFN